MSFPTPKKDVLITGASGVLGSSMARHLATAGFNLHLTSRRRNRLQALESELSKTGSRIFLYELDLLSVEQCERAVDTFFQQSNHPFGMVCNGGDLGVLGTFLEVDFTAWSGSLQHNFVGHAAMIHQFALLYRKQQKTEGAIILMSGAGLGSAVAHTHLSSYGTAKAALTYLAEALAPEFKELNITINAVAPGQIKSGITEQAIRAGVEQAGAYARAAAKCMETGGVSPDLAAKLVEFLMGPQARNISGRLLSARFDQDRIREQTEATSHDPDLFRLRRIDDVLFAKKS